MEILYDYVGLLMKKDYLVGIEVQRRQEECVCT